MCICGAHYVDFRTGAQVDRYVRKIVLADEFLTKAVEMVYDRNKIPGKLDSWFATIALGSQIF